jgi:pyridoxamine 5'-phosphate oxidase
MSSNDIASLRQEYREKILSQDELQANPVDQFRLWFEEAKSAECLEPNAMTLSTATREGQVSSRTVLLKAFDEWGFVFFTNYKSRKARQIAENPSVSLLFTWLPLERQVEINGTAEKISHAESLRYFMSRPLGSRIGAWVSQQSKIIPSRKLLEQKFEEVMEKFADGEVPLPDFWGGYRVNPSEIEFWQGAPKRLHDRFRYVRDEDHDWQIQRLSP